MMDNLQKLINNTHLYSATFSPSKVHQSMTWYSLFFMRDSFFGFPRLSHYRYLQCWVFFVANFFNRCKKEGRVYGHKVYWVWDSFFGTFEIVKSFFLIYFLIEMFWKIKLSFKKWNGLRMKLNLKELTSSAIQPKDLTDSTWTFWWLVHNDNY